MKEKKIHFNKDGKFRGHSGIKYDVVKTEKEIDYDVNGCFDLAMRVIRDTFADISVKCKNVDEKKAIRKNFAVNSNLITMACDCSDTFEEQKLRKQILLNN